MESVVCFEIWHLYKAMAKSNELKTHHRFAADRMRMKIAEKDACKSLKWKDKKYMLHFKQGCKRRIKGNMS